MARRKLNQLTVKAVDAHCRAQIDGKRPIRFGDGGGLYLQVAPGRDGNTASWLFRYTLDKKSREMGLGPVSGAGAVALSEARKRAEKARSLLGEGLDPLDQRNATRANQRQKAIDDAARTFEASARALVEQKRPGWTSDKHAAQWMATFEAYAFPIIGSKPVADISTADVLSVLRPIWNQIPETASRLRQRIEAVLDDARVNGLRPDNLSNPAMWKGHLSAVLPSPKKVSPVENHPSLPIEQMPAFMISLSEHEGMGAKALKFAILTASRTGAVRQMRWNQINIAKALWTIPATNMKNKKLHLVPLSPAAIELLELVRPLAQKETDFVFPGGREGRPLSDMALSQLVRGMACDRLGEGEQPRWCDIDGRVIVPHGFRSTFKGWSLNANYPDHLSEAALAHTDKDKVRAAYAREDLLEQRRPMMEAWAEYCTGASPSLPKQVV